MSLRARLLAGCLVIAVLLASAAVLVTRRTEAHLMDRVDGQLSPRIEFAQECGIEALIGGTDEPPAPGDPPDLGLMKVQCSATHVKQDEGDGGRTGAVTDSTTDTTTPTGSTAVAPVDDIGGTAPEGDPDARESPLMVAGVMVGQGDPLDMFTVMTVNRDGAEPARMPNSGMPQPDVDFDQAAEAAEAGEPFTTGSVGADGRWRVRALEAGGTLWIVAQSLDDVDAIVDGLILIEVAATLLILAALGLVAWWVDRHGIRPIKRMTTTASAIAGGDLSHRVPEAHEGTEAGRLGAALNQMLGRIEEAFDERSRSETRLRQFVADASHELRTPVTTIRGYSDLYESGALEQRGELAEAMRRTRQETLRMGSLVDDLLLLARLDEGLPLARGEVDLAALVDDAGRDAQAVDPARPVSTSTGEPLVVLGDSDRLRQVLANLVGNALVHTPSAAGLELRARRDHDRAVVEIADRGPGMPPDVADRAFERFFRADPSRSRHRGGSGLGLAIVQATVAVHGGDVWIESEPGAGTTACVALPLAPA